MAGDPVHALEAAERAFAEREAMGITQEYSKQSFVTAVEAALELGDLGKVEELLAVVEALPPGKLPQFLQAQSRRFRAQLAARRGEADEANGASRSGGLFRELALIFYLGVTQLEYAEWLAGQGRVEEASRCCRGARDLRAARGQAVARASERARARPRYAMTSTRAASGAACFSRSSTSCKAWIDTSI